MLVSDPPGAPYIEGYTEGETIRRGQTVELVCRSRGGNPPAQLIWYKNGEQIRMAYRTAGRMSENVYTFTADASDNKARYKCEASNIMSKAPLKAEIDLTVLCKCKTVLKIAKKMKFCVNQFLHHTSRFPGLQKQEWVILCP